MLDHLLISVDELWLKGRNRSTYFSKMRSQVQHLMNLYLEKEYQLKAHNQRLIAYSSQGFPSQLLNALSCLPGIFSLSPCLRTNKDLEQISRMAIQEILRCKSQEPISFKIECQRVDKSFTPNSIELNRQIGAKVLEALGNQAKVDVHHPKLTVSIKILIPGVFVGTEKIEGIGGLPLGMSGHLVGLLSGGLDSPVASYMMARRGCSQTLAFFHAWPFVGEEVVDKILALGKALNPYLGEFELHIIPFGEIQRKIAKELAPRYRTIFFRRYMIESANALAQRVGASALLTGDALAQVSSQTLENLSLIDQISPRPILRPLVGFNKREIIALAKKIGSHDISIQPQDDACSALAAKHPILKGDSSIWQEFSRKTDLIGELHSDVQKSLEQAKVHKFLVKSENFLPFQDFAKSDTLERSK